MIRFPKMKKLRLCTSAVLETIFVNEMMTEGKEAKGTRHQCDQCPDTYLVPTIHDDVVVRTEVNTAPGPHS